MSNQPDSSKIISSHFIVFWIKHCMQHLETLRIRKSFPRVVWKNQEFQKTPSDPGYISGYLLGLASYRVSKRFRCTALSVNRSGRVIPAGHPWPPLVAALGAPDVRPSPMRNHPMVEGGLRFSCVWCTAWRIIPISKWLITSWWFQPIPKILVKLDHVPK